MNTRTSMAALAALALLASLTARADFNAALKEYQAAQYDQARAHFTALAELGDCSSQFNLGAMTLHGLGGPQDTGIGAGWLQAAVSNGCQQLVGGQLGALQSRMSDAERRSAAGIVAQYGRDALHAEGIVDPDLDCRNDVRPAPILSARPEYPHAYHGALSDGIVVAELTIGTDGLARDPEILLSQPDSAFAAAAIESWLNTRFAPATRNGVAVECRVQVRLVFSLEGAPPLWSTALYKEARKSADAGDPAAEYLVGLTAIAEPPPGVPPPRGRQLVMWSARDGYPQAQYWMAAQLRAVAACHPQVTGTAWLKHAAEGGDAAAQLALAADLLQHNPTQAQVSEARVLLERAAGSDSYYVRKHVLVLLAASPVPGVRDPATARQLAGKLAQGDVQSDPQMFEALAAADAATGDFGDAVAQQQQAIGKARELSWNVRGMQERLAVYRAGKAWQGEVFAQLR